MINSGRLDGMSPKSSYAIADNTNSQHEGSSVERDPSPFGKNNKAIFEKEKDFSSHVKSLKKNELSPNEAYRKSIENRAFPNIEIKSDSDNEPI